MTPSIGIKQKGLSISILGIKSYISIIKLDDRNATNKTTATKKYYRLIEKARRYCGNSIIQKQNYMWKILLKNERRGNGRVRDVYQYFESTICELNRLVEERININVNEHLVSSDTLPVHHLVAVTKKPVVVHLAFQKCALFFLSS